MGDIIAHFQPYFSFQSIAIMNPIIAPMVKFVKGRIQKKLTTDLVNMVLSPFTPLPPMGLVNKIIVKIGDLFNPPISCQDREY